MTQSVAETSAVTQVRSFAPKHLAVTIVSLILTGVFAASQIGKAIISMPAVRAEMDLGLDVAGVIVAIFAIVGAFGGIGAGAVVVRIGLHRSLFGGLAGIAVGNLLGASAQDAATLITARVLEGVGFFGIILSIPSLLAALLNGERRSFAMAAWSTYMPIGIMLMLFLAPALPQIGWRALWFWNTIFAVALAVYWAFNRGAIAPLKLPGKDRPAVDLLRQAAAVVGETKCLAAAFAFFALSCQMFSLSFALPQFLTSSYGIPVEVAGLLSGFALAVCAAGNIVAGYLLRAGLRIWSCIATALITMSILSICIYSEMLSASAAVILSAILLGVGSLAPGALYASAPLIAPTPDNIPTTIGLLQQASNAGQLSGPIMVGALAANLGWPFAAFAVAPLAAVGALACLLLRDAGDE